MRKLEGLVLLLDHAAHQRAGPRIVAHTDPFQLMRVEDNIKKLNLYKNIAENAKLKNMK